jgi:phosphoglycerate dehydrogenase-like enzyme
MAEHAIALLLSLARALPVYAVEQNAGAFTRGFRETRGERPIEVEGKTLLVVGLGGIGTEVAKRANGLGMHVIATRNSRREGPDYVEYVGLADEYRQLAARADVVGQFDAAYARDTRHVRRAVFRGDERRRVFHQHRPRRERQSRPT